jgi:SAM-dependent methyltransferase
MIDINKVIKKAVERARKTEQLPPFSKVDASSLESLRSRNYPTNRNMNDYFDELPLLQSLLTSDVEVLDIGAGNGIAIEEIANRYQCAVVGTGIEAIENSCINFVIAEASALPFSDNSFVLVISVQGISWAPDQKRAISEAVRILRPGCYCLINLIRFSSSVAIWYGDEFWDEIAVNKNEFMTLYDFHEDMNIPGVEMEITRIPVPEKMYKEKFYIECRKLR